MRKTVNASNLTAPVGPFAHGVWAGDLLFVSGQVGQDTQTGSLVGGGLEAQTRQIFENLSRVLAAAGLKFEHVIKCHVFLIDMSDFAAMNQIYAAIFPAPHPARTTVQVAKLPLGALIEIDLIAMRPVR